MVRLSRRSTSGDLSAIFSASANVSSISASGSTTRFASPSATASSAPMGAPENIISLARQSGIWRIRRCEPPAPGKSPRLISGTPIFAAEESTRMSVESISSAPPPRAKPFTAAIVGFSRVSIRRKRRWMGAANSS